MNKVVREMNRATLGDEYITKSLQYDNTKLQSVFMGRWYEHNIYEFFQICDDIPLLTNNGKMLVCVQRINNIGDYDRIYLAVYYGKTELFFICVSREPINVIQETFT